MQRIRPLKFLNVRIDLPAIILPLALAAGFLIADESHANGPELTLPNGEGIDGWRLAGLDGLDSSIRDIVRPPTPARLDTDEEVVLSPLGLNAPGPEHRDAPESTDVFADVVLSDVDAEPPIPDNSRTAPSGATVANSDQRAAKRGHDAPATVDDTNFDSSPNSDVSEAADAVVKDGPRTLPRQVAALRRPIELCLRAHATHRLDSGRDSCWSMMHAFLGWGPACEIHIGGPNGPRTNAVQWIAQNRACGGRRLFYLDGDRIRGREGPGYQGHPAQFLAMLAQCGISTDMAMRVNGRQFTVADLIEEEKRACREGQELTFTLIGLVHYLGTEAEWSNGSGESWDMPRVVGYELAQPVNGAACGGTHRIMAISYAVAKRRDEGGEMVGQWWRADKFIQDYHRYAMSLQNRDGSFSSDWFRHRSDGGDMDRRVQTTGHILEWLVFSIPDEALYDPRIVLSVRYLTRTLSQNQHHDWSVGPKGHVIRALRLYHERVFGVGEPQVAPLAHRRPRSARNR